MDDWEGVTMVAPPGTPDCEPHTPSPPGYLAHAEWMEEMSKTHTVRRCGGCMRFVIWEPREVPDETAPTGTEGAA